MDQARPEELLARIAQLPREAVLEAALALRRELPELSDRRGEVDNFIKAVEREPFANVEDAEAIARTMLLLAALSPAYCSATQAAVAGVGSKAFVFGGAEIIAAAAIAVCGLEVIVSGGIKNRTEVITVEQQGDKRVVRVERKIEYGISGRLFELITKLMAAGGNS